MPGNLSRRKRMGLLVPSSNTVMEVDFYRNLPLHVTLHVARMYLEETTAEAERRMIEEHVPLAARDLATLRPDLVVFGCTSASAVYGEEGDAHMRDELSRTVGAPVIGVMSSVFQTLDGIGARRLAVLTPYSSALNERIVAGLEAPNREVVAVEGLNITVNFDIATVEPSQIVEFAREKLMHVDCDAVFVSCTNFRAMEALADLRSTFDVPVITSNQVTLDTAVAIL